MTRKEFVDRMFTSGFDAELRHVIGSIFREFPDADVSLREFSRFRDFSDWVMYIKVGSKELCTTFYDPAFIDVDRLIQDVHCHMWLDGWNPGQPKHFLDEGAYD